MPRGFTYLMMNRLFSSLTAVALLGLVSCQGSTKTSTTDSTASPATTTDSLTAAVSAPVGPTDELLDRTFRLDYGEMVAEVTYGIDTLHWKTFTPEGKQTGEGKEQPAYHPLDGNRYLVAWMEADGTSVSQLVDLSEHAIHAAIFAPVASVPSREPMTLTGTVTLVQR